MTKTIIGFSGTQSGMTQSQSDRLRVKLSAFFTRQGDEFHHGDCIGSDVQAAQIAKDLGYVVIAHPGHDSKGRTPKRGYFQHNDAIHPIKPYLERNRDIVDVCTVFFATPKEEAPVNRSGTWSTIRYASKSEKGGEVLYPSRTAPIPWQKNTSTLVCGDEVTF